jgi:hypothetical protein
MKNDKNKQYIHMHSLPEHEHENSLEPPSEIIRLKSTQTGKLSKSKRLADSNNSPFLFNNIINIIEANEHEEDDIVDPETPQFDSSNKTTQKKFLNHSQANKTPRIYSKTPDIDLRVNSKPISPSNFARQKQQISMEQMTPTSKVRDSSITGSGFRSMA